MQKGSEQAKAAGGGQTQKKVRLYDFRRPDKFSKEQLRTLEMIHDNFARLLGTVFSANFRCMAQIEIRDIQQSTYGEFIDALTDPSIIGIVSLPPLDGNAIIEMDADIAFPIIDRLFGGPGQALGQVRSLTELEGVVMQRVFRTVLSGLADAWHHASPFKPRLETIESNPLFVQIVSPSDIVLNVRFECTVGEHQGGLQLSFPYLLLEPVLSNLSAHQWFARERKASRQDEVEKHLEGVAVNVWVRLGEVDLTVRELVKLDVGDVVRLKSTQADDVDVFVEDRLRFRGRAGRRGGRLAVSITEVLDGEEVMAGE